MALNFLNNGYFAGKVGIGVEVPTYTLELQVSQPDENPVVYSQFGGNNGVTGNSFLQIGGARGSAASERYSYLQTLDGAGGFRILSLNPSGGNVGIGTTSPSNPLTVVGVDSIGIDDYILHNGDSNTKFGFPSNDTFKIRTSGVDRLNINSSGNVGIGTASPTGYRLVVENTSEDLLKLHNSTDGLDALISFTNPGGTLARIQGIDNGGLGFDVGNNAGGIVSNAMFIKNNGNVGIGTTLPIGKLNVSKDSTTDGLSQAITVSSSSVSTKRMNLGYVPGSNYAFIDVINYAISNTNQALSLQPNGGNVGIGQTSPTAKLYVQGDTIVRGVLRGDNVNFGLGGAIKVNASNTASDQYVAFGTTPSGSSGSATFTEKMRITSTGNVGIGTTSPTQKLHVAGNARVTGAYYDSNNSPGTANQVLVSTVSGTDWIDGSAIPGVPAGSGTLNTIPLWTPDGDTLGNSVLKQNGNNIEQGVVGTTAGAYYFFNTTTTGDSGLVFKDNASTNSGFLTYNHIVNAMKFATAGSERMRIANGGEVLIGTTATVANVKLRIVQTANQWPMQIVSSYAYGLSIDTSLGTDSNAGSLQIYPNSGGGFIVRNDSKVGIGTTSPNEKLEVVGNIKIQSVVLSNQENTDVDTGTETVAEFSAAAFTAGFFDFVIKKTTNVRSGTVYACHDGTNVEFTETSTQDLGDTSDVTLSVDISGGNMRLRATTTSDNWSVKSLIRAI